MLQSIPFINITFINQSDGPCLVHTLNGDLLRSLDPPAGCRTPELITMSREAFVLVKFDEGQLCNYSMNGRLLQHINHKDNIQVNIQFVHCIFLFSSHEHSLSELYRSYFVLSSFVVGLFVNLSVFIRSPENFR